MLKQRRAFTLIELMIVVLIIGFLLMIAVPQWMKTRDISRRTTCLSNLRQIDNAKEQYAIENKKAIGAVIVEGDIWPAYLNGADFPSCPEAGLYTIGTVGSVSNCAVHGDY